MEDKTSLRNIFLCPITKERMRDPMIASDGYTYEREEIERRFGENEVYSPVTGEEIKDLNLFPNFILKNVFIKDIDIIPPLVNENNRVDFFIRLPKEIIKSVLNYLRLNTLLLMSEVSKYFFEQAKFLIEARIESRFLCPITKNLISNPVVACDGNTYEREAIERWITKFGENEVYSPVTGKLLENKNLFPNLVLKKLCLKNSEFNNENYWPSNIKTLDKNSAVSIFIEQSENFFSKLDFEKAVKLREINFLKFIKGGNTVEIQQFLETYGLSIVPTRALQVAAEAGCLETLDYLLKCGVCIEKLDTYEWTALHWAVWSDHLHIVSYLCEKYPKEIHRRTGKGWFNGTENLLHVAARNSSQKVLKFFIEKQYFCINDKDQSGWTALHWASHKDNVEIAGFLLEKGANINEVDEKKKTPLHWCLEDKNEKCAVLLLENDANTELRDNSGNTAFDGEKNEDFKKSLRKKYVEERSNHKSKNFTAVSGEIMDSEVPMVTEQSENFFSQSNSEEFASSTDLDNFSQGEAKNFTNFWNKSSSSELKDFALNSKKRKKDKAEGSDSQEEIKHEHKKRK